MPCVVRASIRRLLQLAAGLALAACAAEPPSTVPPPAAEPTLELHPTSFDELDGWRGDDPSQALTAFRSSCNKLEVRAPDEPMGPDRVFGRVADWQLVCRAAVELPEPARTADARAFFERWFVPYRVSDGDEAEGLFTGYYEPLLRGSRANGGGYRVPLRRVPDDLVRVELGRFNPDLAGYWIAGRIVGGAFVPYHPRAEIENGVLDGQGLELLWVDDPIDKFFLQIQGSGQVVLEDGTLVRVGYAGQNGHPYRAIGRDLIEIGALDREQVSLQAIRAWLQANPEDARAIMDRNRSYVFFQEHPLLTPEDGPLGAQGVPLTPGRSLAVDLRFIPLGTPLWLETTAPMPEGEAPLRRLVVAQDTGGAIRGVVRGDVFWGAGPRAEYVAGHMKSRGGYAVLLPRALVPTS